MLELDPRLHAYRPDLADVSLQGRVQSARFTAGAPYSVQVPVLPLRKRPDLSLGFESELLFGEPIRVYETQSGWCWVQSLRDGYVGYCRLEGLAHTHARPSHRMVASRTHLYAQPDIKTAPIMALPFGVEIEIAADEGRFLRIEAPVSGYGIAAHFSKISAWGHDPVTEAERLTGVPYLWGGKSSEGLDCSALVQTACRACGIDAPRDSDMQEARLGTPLPQPDDVTTVPRGVLLFWPGHVALSQGGGFMIHANAHHMQVVSEAIGPALARIAAAGSSLRSLRQLPEHISG